MSVIYNYYPEYIAEFTKLAQDIAKGHQNEVWEKSFKNINRAKLNPKIYKYWEKKWKRNK